MKRSNLNLLSAMSTFIYTSSSACAATYYVSPSGNDTATGASITSPWKTLQKAANSMIAGDSCLIRGGVYRETVTPVNSGTASAPIAYMPYNNESVTVNGADTLSGTWAKHLSSGYIYKLNTNFNITTGKIFHQIFVDGKMNLKARWPNNQNLDVFNPSFFASSTSGTSTSFSISNLPKIDLIGAKIWSLPGEQWTSKVTRIISRNNDTVSFNKVSDNLYETPKMGNPLYIYGKLNLLDSPGEWYLKSDGTFYLQTTTSDNPANHTVEVKSREFGFNLDNKSYISIIGINYFACGFSMKGSNFCSIDNGQMSYPDWYQEPGWNDDPTMELDFYRTSQAANFVSGVGNVIKNMNMQFSVGSMIIIGSTLSIDSNTPPPQGEYNTIDNNTIHDLGFSRSDGGAILFLRTGAGNIIKNNTIFNCSIPGIRGKQTKDLSIRYNEIYKTCLNRTDYGAIYIDNNGAQGGVPSEIAYNSVHDNNTGSGIYFDAWSGAGGQGYVIHHNTIYNIKPWAAMHVNGGPASIGSRDLKFFSNYSGL